MDQKRERVRFSIALLGQQEPSIVRGTEMATSNGAIEIRDGGQTVAIFPLAQLRWALHPSAKDQGDS